jgi:hypothetical protein
VALDAGGPTYPEGDVARIRARIRGREGKPLLDARAEAVIYRDDAKVATVRLTPDAGGGGTYRGSTGDLVPGDYEVGVVVEGFSELETRVRTTFTVEPRETRELALLTCDEDLLRAMAEASGGAYLREEAAGRLTEILAPLSEGRIVVAETRLAQSYWWFVPIVLFLTAEWILRKRAGMM